MTDNNSPNVPASDTAEKQNGNASKLRLNFNSSLGSGNASGSSHKSGESTKVSDSSESSVSVPSSKAAPLLQLPTENTDATLTSPDTLTPPSEEIKTEAVVSKVSNSLSERQTPLPLTSTTELSSQQIPEAEVEPTTIRRLAPPLETTATQEPPPPHETISHSSREIVQSSITSQETTSSEPKTDETESIIQEKQTTIEIGQERKSFPKTPRKQDNGTLQDLLIGVVFLVFLAGFVVWGADSLLTWKHDIDIQPNTSYHQLCWSQDGESLAFIRDEIKQISHGQSIKSSLWVNERFGDQAVRLQDNLPNAYQLTGWFADDSLIVLNSANRPLDLKKFKEIDGQKKASSNSEEAPAKEETIQLTEVGPKDLCGVVEGNCAIKPGLSFAEVNTKDRSIRYLNLPIENAQVVGNSQKEVFIAQYLTSDKDRGQINLLTYQPGTTEAKVLVSVPSRQKEMMHVDSVVASPNKEKLAIVISVVASLSKSVSEDDDTPLGVWLFNRENKSLAWTTISANNARDLSVVWSKDSKWLGGVARYVDEAELFAFYGDNDCQAAKLRGVPQEGDIIPLITSNTHALTFVSLNRIDCYNFDQQKNIPLLSSENLEYVPSNFAVASSGAVAYAATPYDAQNIYICALNNPTSHKVNIPDDSAKQTWYYQEVGNLQYALDYWFKAEQR